LADKVAVIGSGLIGRSWAISFSRAGYDVALYDAAPGAADAALGFVDAVLADLHRDGLLNGNKPDAVRGRIKVAATMADALRDAVYVQENTPEKS
jgi:L-gulonate 3-dehydrogenase